MKKYLISTISKILLLAVIFGASIFSDARLALAAVPNSPSNLTATAVSSSQINLIWADNSSDEQGFKFYRSLSGTTGFSQIGSTGAGVTSYNNISGLSASTTYYYQVAAYNASGNSAYSNVASATTQALPTPPAAPTNLAAIPFSYNQIDLSWTDNSTTETSFKLERSLSATTGFTQISSPLDNAISYSDMGLTQNTTYYYRILASNSVGNSAYSNIANATTQYLISLPVGAPSRAVIDENYAYLISGFPNRLVVVDIRESRSPSAIGNLNLDFFPRNLGISGNLLVLVGGNKIVVIDITNPAVPTQLGSLAIPGAYDVAISNNHAYIVSSSPLPFPNATTNANSLKVISLANPSFLSLTSEIVLDQSNSTIKDIAVLGDFAYISLTRLFKVVNIGNPSAPQLVGSIAVPPGTSGYGALDALAVKPGYVFIHWSDNYDLGIRTIDVRNPAFPSFIGQYLQTNCIFSALIVQDNYLYGAWNDPFNSRGGLRIMNIANPEVPLNAGALVTGGENQIPFGVGVSGNNAFIANSAAGFYIVDITDPANPSILSNLSGSTTSQFTLVKSAFAPSDRTGATANQNETLTYTLNYFNPAAAANVVITDNVPPGTTYVEGSAKWNGAVSGTYDGTKITWSPGSLPVNATGTVSFQVTVN